MIDVPIQAMQDVVVDVVKNIVVLETLQPELVSENLSEVKTRLIEIYRMLDKEKR